MTPNAPSRPDLARTGIAKRSVAIVTGGASGIGKGLAVALLERGLSVTVGDVNDSHLADLRTSLGEHANRLHATRLDVANAADWERAMAETEARFGPVDVLCLNAGVGVLGGILASTEADWRWLMQVNLMGVGNGLAAALPGMRARGGGHVMATSSMGGLVAAADGGIYSCAKFGVVAAIEVLRAELGAEGVVATVLCPAAVNTNIHDHEALRPSEFAASGITPSPQEAEKMREFARSILSLGADPIVVGRRTVEAMDRGDAYVFTDGSVASLVELRRDALCSGFA